VSLVSHSRKAPPTLDINATEALLSHFVALSLLTDFLDTLDLMQDVIKMPLDLGLQGLVAIPVSQAVLEPGSSLHAIDPFQLPVLHQLFHVPLDRSGLHPKHPSHILGFEACKLVFLQVTLQPLEELPRGPRQLITLAEQHFF